ncbi:MAG: YMGG-like glycine zipper-containing protein [Blastocatellia bacterium]
MRLRLDSTISTNALRNGRSGAFHADVREILAGESVKAIDEEGNIEPSSRGKDTAIRTGGGAVLGAIIGAIAGGGKGAAIGALIGAGVGAGSVYIQGNKDLILEPGTEMVVRTAAPQ